MAQAQKPIDMPDAQLLEALALRAAELEAARGEYAKVEAALQKAHKAYEALAEERHRRAVDAMVSTGVPDWALLLEETGASGMVMHKACERFLDTLGLRQSGYYPETQQRCLQVSLAPDDVEGAQRLTGSILTLLPHLRPVVDPKDKQAQPAVRLSVMSEDLSASGILSLWVASETTARLTLTRYGQARELYAGSLNDCLLHIAAHHSLASC